MNRVFPFVGNEKSPREAVQEVGYHRPTESDVEAEVTRDTGGDTAIPVIPLGFSYLNSLLAIFAQVGVVIILAVCIRVPIYLSYSGNMSNRAHSLYVTGITVLATLIASHTTGQIRQLWVKKKVMSSSSEHISMGHRRQISTLIGLGELQDKFRYPQISVPFLITGLVVTAIVAGLNPSTVYVKIPTLAYLYPETTEDIEQGASCIAQTDQPAGLWFSWKTPNGTYISINDTSPVDCANAQVAPALSILGSTPVDLSYTVNYKYIQGGVPVNGYAIAAPYDFYYGSFLETFGVSGGVTADNKIDPNTINSAEQCFPIMVTNPVSCQTIDESSISVGSNSISISNEGCNVTTPIFSVDPSKQGASAAGACTDGHDVGAATILIGAVNDHAALLAGVMYDQTFSPNTSSQYAVACTVDIAPSMDFRNIKWSRVPADDPAIASEGFDVLSRVTGSSNDSCLAIDDNGEIISMDQLLTFTTLATGAGASQKLLAENRYGNGWWDILYSAAVKQADWEWYSDMWFAFNDSVNPLADALGIASAVAVGSYLGTGELDGSSDFQMGVPVTSGSILQEAVRVGSGQLWALVFLLPSLFSIATLIYLTYRVNRLVDQARQADMQRDFNLATPNRPDNLEPQATGFAPVPQEDMTKTRYR